MRPVAQIAQSVEQGIENPRVGGSIPSLGTKIPRNPKEQCVLGVFYCLRFNGVWTISGPNRFGSVIESHPTDFRYRTQNRIVLISFKLSA